MITEPVELYTILSKKYNLPVEVIREAVIYFWRSGVKKSLEALISDEVYINKLGSFKIKGYKIKYLIPMAEQLAVTSTKDYTVAYFKLLSEQLLKIQNLIEHKKQSKTKFNELYKQTPRNISQSPEDLGRSQE